MELQQLEQFVAVAEEMHFTRAASRCHVAQSALSTSIRALERDLGAELFVRTTRRVHLSEVGQVLLPEARRVLAAATAARDAVDRACNRVRGGLTIGRVWGDVGEEIARFHAGHPSVEITLRQGLSAQLIDDILNGSLDLAFVWVPKEGLPPGIRTLSTRSVPVGIACSEEHRLSRRRRVTVKQLSGEVFVSDPGDISSHNAVRDFFAKFGVVYQVAFRVGDVASMLELVAQGSALALLPKTAAESRPGICYVPLEGHSLACQAAVIAPNRPLSSATRAFLSGLDGPSQFTVPSNEPLVSESLE
ncbi:MAG TPA: LysR family transcriptional regulator [Acidimicrobiales bacterium]|nr:LysR family transcriptional regulator [Acidimicrobiales bacterium]